MVPASPLLLLALVLSLPMLARSQARRRRAPARTRDGLSKDPRADGVAEFYHTGSGERFVPRGVNYIDFVRDEDGNYRDAVFATDSFDAGRVRAAFHTLPSAASTPRASSSTPVALAAPVSASRAGRASAAVLDNMADVMRIAADTGIYLLLTANSIPDDGGYWEFFDGLFGETHPGFTRRENADYLHTAGVETKARFWDDLLAASPTGCPVRDGSGVAADQRTMALPRASADVS